MTLSERRSRILAFIVDDYVDSALPVGSQALVERHALGLSSATVRNEMAALESEGMITHPHTSAGRIPSHRGYRYYVSSLMQERGLSSQERLTILHQFHQSARELERWVGLAASVLANSMQTLALATQPRVREVRLKQLQLVELSENRALLIVVTNDAAVRQHTIDLPAPANQESLSRLAARLNTGLGGLTAAEFAARAGAEPIGGNEAAIVASVAELLLHEQDAMAETPVIEGVRDLLRKPEFDESDRMLDTLEAVDERHLQHAIPLAALEHGQVAIVIGDENREGPYQDMSFVLARYGPADGAGGVVGVLGPTRIAYGDAVAHVRYVSELLTGLMRQFYED
ncbi:MAG: heat-inducible transcription repressor HrcA [Dehalococcoidia bacterium]|nr:heat-inducible transcription repressor HrcA [Chloroflexi bacterium CFX7]MCK6564776.1 heat-inducible transcriptional repressor HrcA [Dehalococcoidia bacterium]MCL4230477.1 heat-inducible transcription repressor HrcA [Dehalococcoidia bacterium]NUQ55746.1 heat-inducible transcription repressor HrcA [Dehalococcoidia bacterium]